MQSDIIHVTNDGVGIEQALEQAERVAAFKSLSHKDALHLRLLAEEMMGMLRGLTGEREADFWIDDAADTFRLHLKAQTLMNAELRKKLLSASTSGQNSAVKGVMGKIRDLFNRLLEPADSDFLGSIAAGMTYDAATVGDMSMMSVNIWSLNQYRAAVQKETDAQEVWDELEKSVVARLAGEVEIGIADRTVEMVIYKKF